MVRHPLAIGAVAVVQFLSLSSRANAELIQCGVGDVQCLISAINEANLDSHPTTIRLAGGVYALTSVNNVANGPNGLPSITSPVTIEAGTNGATLARQSDADSFRILHVGADGRLTLDGITLQGGDAALTGDQVEISGGAILNAGGVITIRNSVFDANGARNGTGTVFIDHGKATFEDTTFTNNYALAGAAIANIAGTVEIIRTALNSNRAYLNGTVWSNNGTTYIFQSRFADNAARTPVAGLFVSGGTASVLESTFQRNCARVGGAIAVDQQANVTIRNSAIVENCASQGGAGIRNGTGTVTIINVTFGRNTAGTLALDDYGTAVENNGTMTILNSTFAENAPEVRLAPASTILSTGTTTLQNTILVHDDNENRPVVDCAGTVTSLGNNLIGDPSPCNLSIQLTDKVGDAGLGDLVDDGTPGNAHYPLLGDSAAINAANAAACPKKDQIGRPRTRRCDIGAVEFENRQ